MAARTARIILLDAEDEHGAPGLHEDDVRRCVPDLQCIETLRLRRDRKPLVARRDGVRQPVDWQALGSALKRLLGDVHEARGRDPAAVTIVAGVGPLPMFAVAGFELERVSPLVLVNRRQRQPMFDVLTFDHTTTVAPTQPGSPGFFDGVPLPRDRSEARGLVAVGISTGAPIERDQMQAFAREVGFELAGVAHLHKAEPHAGHAPLTLDAGNALLAAAQLFDTVRVVHESFPRRDAIALFIRGPAPLAFLAGRAIGGGVTGRVLLPLCREERDGYEPAFELRGPRAGVDYACVPHASRAKSPTASVPPRCATLLFLSANPLYVDSLRPDAGPQRLPCDEHRAIKDAVLRARYRDSLCIEPHHGTRPEDILPELRRVTPQVVHFSGHGFADGAGIVLQSDADAYHRVTPDALLAVFQSFAPQPRLVVLNGCHTDASARALACVIEAAIGVRGQLDDALACTFAAEFYAALAAAESVQRAFEQARETVRMRDPSFTPKLRLRAGPNAAPIFIVPPPEETR